LGDGLKYGESLSEKASYGAISGAKTAINIYINRIAHPAVSTPLPLTVS